MIFDTKAVGEGRFATPRPARAPPFLSAMLGGGSEIRFGANRAFMESSLR
jgi:hypothetical protein